MKHAFVKLISIFLSLSPLLAVGGTEGLYGKWEGGDTASQSIFGTIEVSKSEITWSGYKDRDPRCTVTYQQVEEGYGVEFRDQVGKVYVTAPNSPYRTYLLKINGGKCALGITHFRLTIDDASPSSLAMIEYKGLDRHVGLMHFYRR